MIEYYVVSKSKGWRVHCTGPVTAQVEMGKLVEAGNKADDLTINMVEKKKPLLHARPSAPNKKSSKLRYK